MAPHSASRTRRRRHSESETGTWLLVILLFCIALLALIGLFYLKATTTRPSLDKQTLCPIDGGARSTTVVLLDTSDQWPEITRAEVRKRLEKLAADTPYYGLLELRLLDPDTQGGRIMFSKCNPGNGVNESEITANPVLMQKRWKEQFLAPLEEALNRTLTQADTTWSPILSSVQRIAVDRFNDNQTGHLVLISDMIEHTPDYSQYKGDLSYEHYKQSAAYKKQHTDLHHADVRIFYVQRLRSIDSGKHMEFWTDWVADNKGVLIEAEKLQGAD
jgi:hypothetical protein